MIVTIREIAIAKLQQLPESLVQEIIDFIDFITRNRQAKAAIDSLEGDRSGGWSRWFEATDSLESVRSLSSDSQTLGETIDEPNVLLLSHVYVEHHRSCSGGAWYTL